MPAPTRVAVVVGSLRKESFNRKLALALKAMAPAAMTLEIAEIGQFIPLSEDLYTETQSNLEGIAS